MAASVLMSIAWICFRCCIRARVTAEIRFGGPAEYSPLDFRSSRISRSCRMIDIRWPIGMLKKMLWIDSESLKICWKLNSSKLNTDTFIICKINLIGNQVVLIVYYYSIKQIEIEVYSKENISNLEKSSVQFDVLEGDHSSSLNESFRFPMKLESNRHRVSHWTETLVQLSPVISS